MGSRSINWVGAVVAGMLLLGSSCAQQNLPVQYKDGTMKIEHGVADPAMNAEIAPYRDSMNSKMQVILVQSDTILNKAQPEGSLGNMLVDLLKDESDIYIGGTVDVAILNHGGVRLTQLAKGPVTMGKVYEIMPFENRMVFMQLKGSVMQQVFDAIAAAGGWPVSGARFVINKGKATQVQIGGEPLDLAKVYTLSISGYLADGGDNMSMLKGLPQTDSGFTLRDALINACTKRGLRGEKLHGRTDGRITVAGN
jgi:2',3'-cyclic-nucleotide 2'-phosphodiesterase (5'-nucleotidase family)